MANIRTELGRHRYVHGLKRTANWNNGHQWMRCKNCGLWWDMAFESKAPVTGCVTDLDASRVKAGGDIEKGYLRDQARMTARGEWPEFHGPFASGRG